MEIIMKEYERFDRIGTNGHIFVAIINFVLFLSRFFTANVTSEFAARS